MKVRPYLEQADSSLARSIDLRGDDIPDQGMTYAISKHTPARLAAAGCSRSLPGGDTKFYLLHA